MPAGMGWIMRASIATYSAKPPLLLMDRDLRDSHRAIPRRACGKRSVWHASDRHDAHGHPGLDLAESLCGAVFATTLGHPRDFAVPPIMRLVINGIHWAAVDVHLTAVQTFDLPLEP